MKLIILNKVSSTHKYLQEYIEKNGYNTPVCVFTNYQTNGVGSRGNIWEGTKGNLFFSFVLDKSYLPKDLPIQSASIYFSYILKKVFNDFGSKLWLKWPNDFYIDDKKIGGTITTLKRDLLYCGIGINLIKVSENFGFLDIQIECENILGIYLKELKKIPLWKNVFSQFVIEFERSKKFSSNIGNESISLENCTLNRDGSITIENRKVFSLR